MQEHALYYVQNVQNVTLTITLKNICTQTLVIFLIFVKITKEVYNLTHQEDSEKKKVKNCPNSCHSLSKTLITALLKRASYVAV